MALCKNISPKKRKLCAGDLNKPIKIQVRMITAKKIGQTDFTETFTDVVSVFAAIDTSKGFSSFNDIGVTSTGGVVNFTHRIYIRFSTNFTVTSENWVLFNDEKYTINSVENLEERNEWLILYCIKKGDSTKKGNFA